MTVDASVSLVRVSKGFGATLALDRVSFSLRPGDAACVEGPNGSGKSTLLGLVAGLGTPSSGEVRVGGVSSTCAAQAGRSSRVGYLPQQSLVYEHLTGLEHLRFMAQLGGAGRGLNGSLETTLREFGLEAQARRPIRLYSTGMKRKIALLSALIHEPDVILLDEPVVGIDARGTARAVALLREAQERGASILIATHRAGAFAPIANRWLHLRQGRLTADRSSGRASDIEQTPARRAGSRIADVSG